MTTQVLHEVQSVLRDTFFDRTIEVDRNSTAADVSGWDSLSHVRLLLALESRFGVKFKALEAVRLKNVGELVDLIQAKLVEGESAKIDSK